VGFVEQSFYEINMSIEKLRAAYPWPETIPQVPDKLGGWFCGENQAVLRDNLGLGARFVVELGSWQGMSAKFIAQHAPNAFVACVDHWQGSQEHHSYPAWAVDLPTLYDTFLRNLWQFRDRVIPVKETTQDGMQIISSLELMPDLVYIDAAHDTESVASDVATALRLFPKSVLVGDDWSWDSVRAGVERAFSCSGREIQSKGVCWYSFPEGVE
jgi:hypothetical protein